MIKRGRVFQIILILLIFGLDYFNKSVTLYPKDASLSKMTLKAESTTFSHSDYQLLWFEMAHRTIQVKWNGLLNVKEFSGYAISTEGKVVEIPASQLRKSLKLNAKKYDGTFDIVLAPISKDLDGDGVKEKIILSAKCNTLFTQSKTNFLDPRIPFEIAKGNQQITVYLNQKPLAHQTLQLISQRGTQKEVTTDEGGNIDIADIWELRKGIMLIYRQGNTYYISSYLQEAYSVFSKRHGIALVPLGMILVVSFGLIGLFILGRALCSRYHARYLSRRERLYLLKNDIN